MRRLPGWVPREDRDAVIIDGLAVVDKGNTIDVVVTNLTESGCQLQLGDNLVIGSIVSLSAGPRHNWPGQIRWCVSGEAGLRSTSRWA